MATVTNAEYQQANNSLNNQYTADSLQNYQTAYKDYMSQGMSSKDAVNKAKSLLVAKGTDTGTNTGATTSSNSTYQNQGAGNYVYNEKTGYYENQTDTTKNTVNQDVNKTTEVIKQEAPTKQEETVVKTDNEIKQEGKLAPLSKEYYSQTSDEAQNTIRNNLNGYRQTNPELFSSYDEFKKNFSYDARDDIQKQTLDNWYKGYEKGIQLSSIPVNELYTQYKDGSVSLSDLESLRISNPEKYAELQETINKGNIISAYDDDKGADTGMSIQDMAYNAAMQMFTKWMSGDTSSGASQIFREYEQKMEDPEMLELSDNCTEVQEQMENIQSDIDSMKKQVEAEYEGTGASRAKINAIIADRTYDLQLQLRTLNSEYNKYATQYNNRMQQYQNEFNMQLQEYQINQQARSQQMDELGFALDLMNFETNDQKQEREWNYWVKQQEYQNGNINSKDYQTRYKAALTSVQNLLSQYEGIPMERSAEQMAQDVLKAIDNGSDLGTELTKINKLIQGKPEYKQVYNATFGTSSQGFGKTVNIGGTDYVEYNGQLYTAEDFNKQFGKGTKANYTVVGEDKLKYYSDGRDGTYGSFMSNPKYDDKNYIGECAKFVNNYLEHIGAGRLFGNEDIATRKGWINSDEGKVGTIAVFDYNHKSSDGINHGHVGIVVSAPDKNGDFWVKDANFDSDGIIQTRKVNLKDVSLQGFIDPTLDQNGNRGSVGTSSTGTTTTVGGMSKAYEPTRVGLYDKYINEGTAPTDAKLKALGGGDLDKGWQIFDAEVADYMDKTGAGTLEKRTNDELTKLRTQFNQEQTVKDYKDMLTNYSKIEIAANKGTPQGDMSLIFAYMKMLDPGSVVREGEYATAQNAGDVGDKIINLYNKAITGNKLTEDQRKEFLETAKSLMDGMTVNYNNLLDDYASYISWGGDANKIGKKGTYLTDEYINKYGNSSNQGTQGTQEQNFYQKYANTAPGTGKKRPFGTNSSSTIVLSDGQSFQWN